MGELGEYWRDVNQASADKRAANREKSAEILRLRGINFKSKNNGVHLVVYGLREVIDFWPGTGKYVVRGSGVTGRGVRNLLKLCHDRCKNE